jgi:hypothetical protein
VDEAPLRFDAIRSWSPVRRVQTLCDAHSYHIGVDVMEERFLLSEVVGYVVVGIFWFFVTVDISRKTQVQDRCSNIPW